jgi:hypothetical protein
MQMSRFTQREDNPIIPSVILCMARHMSRRAAEKLAIPDSFDLDLDT